MKNSILYGFVTGVSFLLAYWFFILVSERTEGWTWAYLIFGASAAVFFVLSIFVRWQFSERLSQVRIKDFLQSLTEQSADAGRDGYVDAEKFKTLVSDIKENIPRTINYAQTIVTLLILSFLTVEIVALANTAVSYLQAQRLTEQNKLIRSQKQVQAVTFLGTSIEVIDRNYELRKQIAEERIPSISSDFSAELGIVSDLVAAVTGDTAEKINVDNFFINVCVDDTGCDSLTLEQVRTAVEAGQLDVTDENVAAIRAIFRLTKALEIMLFPFVSDGTDSNINSALDARTKTISLALRECRIEQSFVEVWDGFSSAALASSSMWPVESAVEIIPGRSFEFADVSSKANFLGLSAALELLNEANGDAGQPIRTAQDGSVVVQKGLLKLSNLQQAVEAGCNARIAEIDETISVVEGMSTIIRQDLKADLDAMLLTQ